MVLAKAVARLYLIADGNENPLLARVSLIPDLVPPHVSLTTHLEQSSLVRALVECGDGELLEVSRWVWVMPAEG
jgi:predicted secreted protein